MFQRVYVIALNTYREAVRARILLGLAGVAFAAAFYSVIVGAYTLHNAPRVVSDIGAATISMFSVAVTILIGATTLHRELEQKTIFPILARPVRRGEYLAGKYLGTFLTLIVFVMADSGVVLLLSAALGGRSLALVGGVGLLLVGLFVAAAVKWPAARTYGPIPWAAAVLVAGAVLSGAAPVERRVVLSAALLTVMEMGVVGAIALLFSSFSTPFLSSLLTLLLFIVGREADLLPKLPVKIFGQTLHDMGVFLSKIVPNLHLYVPARPLLAGETVDVTFGPYAMRAFAHAAGWSLALLAAAGFLFKRRDFL